MRQDFSGFIHNFDLPEKNIMENPPRNPKDKILTKETMRGIAFSEFVMGLAAL
jgi:Ca2+-transporting ATPase